VPFVDDTDVTGTRDVPPPASSRNLYDTKDLVIAFPPGRVFQK